MYDEVKKWLYSKEISENLYREGDDSADLPEEFLRKENTDYLLVYENAYYKVNQDGTATTLFRYADRLGQCDDYYSNFGERSIRGNLWKGFSSDGGNLAKEGGISFKNGKKPKRLIKQLIKSVTSDKQKDNLIVLDFFAGSGTTAEAVLDLNKDDNGSRSFILCTNNENNICRDKTYLRVKNVITGKLVNNTTYSDGRLGSLKYYKIDFVPISDKLYYEYADELLLHVRELVELENGINFNGNNEIAIVLNDEEMEHFVNQYSRDDVHIVSTPRVLYRGHDVLLTAEQEVFVKTHDISVNVIPDYYYNELNK